MPACAREEPGMNVIEARGLTKVYGGRAVVSDFAMTVAAGDIYGFVGKNGAGKSTVMKMICGDVLPTAGEVVLFEGDRVSAGAAGAARAAGSAGDGEGVRRIGVLIEELALLPNLSAYRNLEAKALAWGIVDGPALCEEALRLGRQQEGARVLPRHEAAAGAGHGVARQPGRAAARRALQRA